MAFRWPKEGVSVVLLPSGELGQQVLSLAKEWTAHRLLAPSLFLVVEEQDPRALEPFKSNGPVGIAAHVIGRNGSVVDSLIDQLGRDDIDLLRVIACRFVEDTESFHHEQDRLIDRICEQVKSSIVQQCELGVQPSTYLSLIGMQTLFYLRKIVRLHQDSILSQMKKILLSQVSFSVISPQLLDFGLVSTSQYWNFRA